MSVAPERCAVIEDSVSGVEAGLAAGMTVFAFTGSVTSVQNLEPYDVVLFDAMQQLPELLVNHAY